MESFEYPTDELLTKFSHASVILKFYGCKNQVEVLMNALSHKTRKAFKDNQFAFGVLFHKKCSTIEYLLPFDQNILEYLLDQERYRNYKLKVRCCTSESYEIFASFLDCLEHIQDLKIDEINCAFIPSLLNEYNALISKLSLLEIDLACITNYHDFHKELGVYSFSESLQEGESISFVPQLDAKQLYNNRIAKVERFEWAVEHGGYNFGYISKIWIQKYKSQKFNGVIFKQLNQKQVKTVLDMIIKIHKDFGINKYRR